MVSWRGHTAAGHALVEGRAGRPGMRHDVRHVRGKGGRKAGWVVEHAALVSSVLKPPGAETLEHSTQPENRNQIPRRRELHSERWKTEIPRRRELQ